VINLPVSICYGVAAASVPALSAARAKAETQDEKTGKKSVRKRLFFSLGITALIALPSALGLYFFAEPAVKIIYRSLKGEELTTLVQLIRIFSVSTFTLSCAQTLSACLTAQGKPQYGALSMLIAVGVKTLVYTYLLKNPEISVFGLAHAGNACYLVAFLLNLLYNLFVSKRIRSKKS
jgi:O-antigen/teichoic acid export membrane protein